MADVAALSEGVGRLTVDPLVERIDGVFASIRNLRVVPEVRSRMLEQVEAVRLLLEIEGDKAFECMRLRRELRVKEEGLMDAAVELRGVREEGDAARGELELERAGAAVELRGVRDELALLRGELESVRNEMAVVLAEGDEA